MDFLPLSLAKRKPLPEVIISEQLDYWWFPLFKAKGRSQPAAGVAAHAPPVHDKLVESLVSLTRENMAEYYDKEQWPQCNGTFGWNDEAKRIELLDESNAFVIVYDKRPETPVAFMAMCQWGAALFILELQVIEAYQRRGIGKQLLAIAAGVARNCGLSEVSLTVQKSNAQAQRFYERCGFHEQELKGLWTSCADALSGCFSDCKQWPQ